MKYPLVAWGSHPPSHIHLPLVGEVVVDFAVQGGGQRAQVHASDTTLQPRRTWSALGADGGRAGTRLGRDADATLLAQGAGGWTPTAFMMSQDNGRTWTPVSNPKPSFSRIL